MNSSEIKQTMVLVLQNHDSWKCDQPSIKAGLHQCVKYCPVYLPVCFLHVYARKMFLRNCVNAPPVCVQVERFHPSPGSVWCRRNIYCQNPGLLLSVPLLLQPAVPGSNIKTTQNKTKQVFLHVDFIQYVWLLIIHQIVSNIGEEMGTIWKKWPGFNDEHNMDHEYFGLEGEFKEMWFPIPHEVVPKVLLSCYLVEANTKVKLIKIKLLRTWWTCMTLFTHLSRHVLLRKWEKRVKLNLDNLTII